MQAYNTLIYAYAQAQGMPMCGNVGQHETVKLIVSFYSTGLARAALIV